MPQVKYKDNPLPSLDFFSPTEFDSHDEPKAFNIDDITDVGNIEQGAWESLDTTIQPEELEIPVADEDDMVEQGYNNDDDDEFKDAQSDDEEDMQTRKGTLKRLPNAFYSDNPSRPLYIPITQDMPPMTEDAISQQQNLFATLGSSIEASQIRARMQSASLFSDMQCFKAANPDCCLQDFLQWYSPRDVQSSMSTRMKHKNNMWQKMWEHAEAIPAMEQRPLFDHNREAELILHNLENMQPEQWMQQYEYLPNFIHFRMLVSVYVLAYYTLRHSLATNNLQHFSLLQHEVDGLKYRIHEVFKSGNVLPERLYDLIEEFETVESLICLAISLQHKVCQFLHFEN